MLHHSPSSSNSSNRFYEYLWRTVNFRQMDFQYTYSQMVDLCRSPHDVYKSTKFRKQIKNQWARDDPAFVVILAYFIVVATFAYSMFFGFTSFFHFLRVVVGHVFIEFLFFGMCIATFMRWFANKHMKSPGLVSVAVHVEWLYAFDIHCNAFFPFFVLLYVVQYFLSPILIQKSFLSCVLANALYAFAGCYYLYITFLGYSILPFLQRTERFLFPCIPMLVCTLIATIAQVNMCRFALSFYFDHAIN